MDTRIDGKKVEITGRREFEGLCCGIVLLASCSYRSSNLLTPKTSTLCSCKASVPRNVSKMFIKFRHGLSQPDSRLNVKLYVKYDGTRIEFNGKCLAVLLQGRGSTGMFQVANVIDHTRRATSSTRTVSQCSKTSGT